MNFNSGYLLLALGKTAYFSGVYVLISNEKLSTHYISLQIATQARTVKVNGS